MATTGAYKEYERLGRVMTVEDAFNFGMSYVDTPLSEGYAKLLVNYDVRSQGANLSPRGGLKILKSRIGDTTLAGTYYLFDEALGGTAYAIHHVGTTLVESATGQDATIHKYILVTDITRENMEPDATHTYHFDDVHCFVEVDGVYVKATLDFVTTGVQYSSLCQKLKQVHGSTVAQSKEAYQGMCISIDANTYIPVRDTTSNAFFMRLSIYFVSGGGVHFTFVPLEPKEISPAQAINTGYNMLKPNPYDFPITTNATGALVLEGVVPKDKYGVVKLTADVGETLNYNLIYSYPTSQAQFVVQWEVNNLANSTEKQVIVSALDSPAYTAGSEVSLPYTVAYKQFTIVVKVFLLAHREAYNASTKEKPFEDTYAPIKVITMSSYYTSADVSRRTANLTPRKFNIANCKGVCTWQQRAVVWGVPDAATTLFMSQPNLPEYFPYPNNVEMFTEEIVKCVPYLTDLLVYTTNKVYRLTMQTDGVNTYYTTKCIQEGVPMTQEDAATILVVKNMVYFKSGNYFYMMVPNNKAGAGELQLAPVSRPIEPFLDNFHTAVYNTLDTLYDFNELFGITDANGKQCDLQFVDYTNYLDGAIVRNVYKCKLVVTDGTTTYAIHYIDFVLNYDTVSRAWTTYAYESTAFGMIMHENTVTSGTQYVSIADAAAYSGTGARPLVLNILAFDNTSPKDEAVLNYAGKTRVFANYQLIDTGYREHYSTYKKRFREIQFGVNNITNDVLHFYTSFTVDDDKRKDLYTYQVQQITDPNDPNYGLIFIDRALDIPSVPGVLSMDTVDDGWELDFAQLEHITLAKVRFRVSGKGYVGKIQIVSKNEACYELLNIMWVYRKMNGR